LGYKEEQIISIEKIIEKFDLLNCDNLRDFRDFSTRFRDVRKNKSDFPMETLRTLGFEGFQELWVGEKQIEYENKYNEIMGMYKKINLHVMYVPAVGAYCTDLYLAANDEIINKEYYHIYIPLPLKNGKVWNFNAVYTKNVKLQTVVTEEDEYDFCRYLYQKHRDSVTLEKFMYDAMSYELTSKEPYKEYEHKPCIVTLDTDTEIRCLKKLAEYEICSPYVCIFARDSQYHLADSSWYDPFGTNTDKKYFNTDFESYKKAIDYLTEKNIQCIRIGRDVEMPLEYRNVVDFSTKFYTEEMDVYIQKHCLFYLGQHSGIQSMLGALNVPCILLNVVKEVISHDLYGPVFYDRDLYVPQLLWSKKEKRYLTLRERIEYELWSDEHQQIYKYIENGYELRKNTSEDIKEVAVEMIKRKLEPSLIYDDEDEELQYQYRNVLFGFVKQYPKLKCLQARIGRDFIRKNRFLLD